MVSEIVIIVLRNICFIVFLLLNGCATISLPVQEYSLARTAMEYAERNDGERLAPLTYQQAQQVYNQAVKLYEIREYDEAKALFIKARKLAEKSENAARVKKAKTGEVM